MRAGKGCVKSVVGAAPPPLPVSNCMRTRLPATSRRCAAYNDDRALYYVGQNDLGSKVPGAWMPGQVGGLMQELRRELSVGFPPHRPCLPQPCFCFAAVLPPPCLA